LSQLSPALTTETSLPDSAKALGVMNGQAWRAPCRVSLLDGPFDLSGAAIIHRLFQGIENALWWSRGSAGEARTDRERTERNRTSNCGTGLAKQTFPQHNAGKGELAEWLRSGLQILSDRQAFQWHSVSRYTQTYREQAVNVETRPGS